MISSEDVVLPAPQKANRRHIFPAECALRGFLAVRPFCKGDFELRRSPFVQRIAREWERAIVRSYSPQSKGKAIRKRYPLRPRRHNVLRLRLVIDPVTSRPIWITPATWEKSGPGEDPVKRRLLSRPYLVRPQAIREEEMGININAQVENVMDRDICESPETQAIETPPTSIANGPSREISGDSPKILTNTPPKPRSDNGEPSKCRSNTPTSTQPKRRRKSNRVINYTQVEYHSDSEEGGGYLEELGLRPHSEPPKEDPNISLPKDPQDIPLPMCPSPYRIPGPSSPKRHFPETDLDAPPPKHSSPNRIRNIPSLKRSLPEEESDISLLKDFLDKATAKKRAKITKDESVKSILPQQQHSEPPRTPLEKLDPNFPSPQRANIDTPTDATTRVGDSEVKEKSFHYRSDRTSGTFECNGSSQHLPSVGGLSSDIRHLVTPILKSRIAPQPLPRMRSCLKAITLDNTNRNKGAKRRLEDIHELNRQILNDPSPPMERSKRRYITWDQQLTYFKDPDHHLQILDGGVGGTALAPKPPPILGRLLRERRREVERGEARTTEGAPKTRPEYGLEASIVAQTAETGEDMSSSEPISGKRRKSTPKPKVKRYRETKTEAEKMGGAERAEEANKPVPPSRIPSRRGVSNTPLRKSSALGGVVGERRSLRNRVQAQPHQ